VPTHVIIAGFVGGGVARGLCVGILVTAISLFFVPFQVHSWVFAQVSGSITQLNIKDNQFVNAGDVLFVIDKTPFHIAELNAQAQ
ncbi:biotin/lipoyl-binding protein, partial [Salmonella enterica subsp. enterica serovar Virginia]|nr:biotin/lipoyl-binding protein [Salmonella enterica subsp. enterica serovar Virginia]